MIVIDTNVIAEAVRARPDPSVLAWLAANKDLIRLTAINIQELACGLALLPAGRRKADLEGAVHALVLQYRSQGVLAYDDAAGAACGVMLADLRARGIALNGPEDVQIAAIASVHGHSVATRNVRHIAPTGVDVINPWDSAPA